MYDPKEGVRNDHAKGIRREPRCRLYNGDGMASERPDRRGAENSVASYEESRLRGSEERETARVEAGAAEGYQTNQEEKGAQAGEEPESRLIIDPLSLPYVMMSEMHYLPTCAGLYFAIEDSQHIAYIGQSRNVCQRWQGHHVKSKLCDLSSLESARRVKIAWLEISDVESLQGLERAMIRQFRPRLNTRLNGNQKPVTPRAPRKYSETELKRRAEARKRYMDVMKVITPRALKRRALDLAIRMAQAEIDGRGKRPCRVLWQDREGHPQERTFPGWPEARTFKYEELPVTSGYLEEARRIMLAEYTLVNELPEPLPEISRPSKPGPRPKKAAQNG
jgi:hypothetical protein